MSIWSAILVVGAAVGLVWLDVTYNESFLISYLVRGLIDIIEWLAFWR